MLLADLKRRYATELDFVFNVLRPLPRIGQTVEGHFKRLLALKPDFGPITDPASAKAFFSSVTAMVAVPEHTRHPK